MPLHDVTDWVEGTACVPTALAGASGKTIAEVMAAINAVADAEKHRHFTQYEGIPPGIWIKALGALGLGDRSDVGHAGMTIDQLMHNSISGGVVLVLTADTDLGVGHVFASYNGHIVDSFTRGKITPFTEVPTDMKGFKVKSELF